MLSYLLLYLSSPKLCMIFFSCFFFSLLRVKRGSLRDPKHNFAISAAALTPIGFVSPNKALQKGRIS